MAEDSSLEELARRAIAGQRDAVSGLVRALQGDIYGLALRILWRREDAEDATQEILIRAITRLSQFDFRSQLKTWVYRVATNYLLDVRKSPVERLNLSFEGFAGDLLEGLSSDGPAENERSVLTEEVKIGCTLAMLQCLDRPHRLAYVLGEILELAAPEAAEVVEIEPTAFRKRLQRAREAIESFTGAYCGLVSDAAACRCNLRVAAAVRLGRASADSANFADKPSSFVEARSLVRSVEQARWALQLHRASRPRDSVVDFARQVVTALDPTNE